MGGRSFSSILRFEKFEVHKVHLHFSNLDLTKNLSPTILAAFFRASFFTSRPRAKNYGPSPDRSAAPGLSGDNTGRKRGKKKTVEGIGILSPQPIRAKVNHSRSSELRLCGTSKAPARLPPCLLRNAPNDRLSPTDSSLSAHSDGHPRDVLPSPRGADPRSLVYRRA